MNGMLGQSSFEMTMIVVIVLLVSVAVVSNLLQVSDETIGLAAAKASITEKLLKQPKTYTIDKLQGIKCGTSLHMQFTTIPDDLTTTNFNNIAPGAQQIPVVQADVANATGFDTIDMKVNENITPCP